MITEDLYAFVQENCDNATIGIASAQDLSEEQISRVAKTNEILSAYTPLLQGKVSVPEKLVFPEIAPLVNISDAVYTEMFEDTFLEYVMMDKFYLQRNAAIALGKIGTSEAIAAMERCRAKDPSDAVREELDFGLAGC